VFKNTYTRDGQRLQVKGWSVKIQFQGRRRTFSLSAGNRQAAATEARALFQRLLAGGWEAVANGTSSERLTRSTLQGQGAEPEPAKSDPAYWRARLLLRRYSPRTTGPGPQEYSARIEHLGRCHYFPLGTLDEESAAQKACRIFETVATRGWDAANRYFRREVTVAIRWAADPLAWTYFTLHTRAGTDRVCPPTVWPRPTTDCRIVVVATDPTIARALAECIDGQLGFAAATIVRSLPQVFPSLKPLAPKVLLLDHRLTEQDDAGARDRLRAEAPALPVVDFSVHEDSDELFKATPGGASGYLLKRTPAQRLLEPIMSLLSVGRFTEDQLRIEVQRYFRAVPDTLAARAAAPATTPLTHREHEVLNLLSKGYLDKEIADALGISTWTVHGHVKSIFQKLGVHTRTEAAVKYLHK
jgi:DNA-binding NarL/FixJ family response regulator